MEIITFLLEFLGEFFTGFAKIFIGIYEGIIQMFNIPAYLSIFGDYSGDFVWWQLVISILILLVIIGILVCVVWLAIHFIRRGIRALNKNALPQEVIDEISSLNQEVRRLNKEKDKILEMKSGTYDANGGGGSGSGYGESGDGEAGDDDVQHSGVSRFYKLTEVDTIYGAEDYVPRELNSEISLEEICENFRNFACSQLRLFYDIRVIRLFFSAFATTRMIILQGISGTGKTSLPYAVGVFLDNETTIVPVQPSWRDRTEIFGYFNDFTKSFNETEVLKKMYEATMNEQVYLTVLDEMNIARVEYYFAEMLSILEMPTRDKWIVDLVASGWDTDPKGIVKGRFNLPENMWYIGTANNDDSTFAISDKVYDRAIPININSKGVAFDAPNPGKLQLDFRHLESLFKKAQNDNVVSDAVLAKIDDLDNYVIEHFRLAFGNRIVKQLKEFVPVYVAAGGTEIDGIDYVLANKILRKFESLNLSYIRDEIDGLVNYLSKNFGKDNMGESKEYLNRLKKLF